MKIAQINAVCDFGSTGRIVSEMSDYLSDNNIENIILYGNGETKRNNAIKIGNKTDHKIHALLSRITGKQGYFSKKATKKALKYLDEFKPDIIHLHNLHNNYINLKLLFKYIEKNDIATVITLHDCFFFTGKCVYYSIVSCERWKKKCGKCPQLQSGNASWGADKTSEMLSDKKAWYSNIPNMGVIGVSKWVTDEAKQSILGKAKFLTTVYNWIDLKLFCPHKSDIRSRLNIGDKYIILGVSITWSNEKGLEDFNKLANMLDDRFQIVLVGAKNSPINEKILHIKRTENAYMLSDLYAAADVFYNPTRRETFGKVTAEALACGTPVIAYKTTACTELVHEECGYVEQIGDINSVYKDILKIIEGKFDYTEACRSFAVNNFDKNDRLSDTVKLYKELLKQKEGKKCFIM